MLNFQVKVNDWDSYISKINKGLFAANGDKEFKEGWSFITTKIQSNAKIFDDNHKFIIDHANAFRNNDFKKIYLD